MAKNINPPATPSAMMHAERIRAGEQASAAKQDGPAGQSTAEMYAARILPGYKADEALREEARRNELRARGTWVPGDDDLEEDEPEEVEETTDPTDNPERRSAKAAWKSARVGGYLAL